MRDTSLASDLKTRAGEQKVEGEIIELDVTDAASIETAVAGTLAAAGRIDVLVNNAAIGWLGAVEEADLREARSVFETNFFGPVRLIQLVLPGMRERRSGTIVNVSSIAGRIPEPYSGIYGASKQALEALSESLYFELQPFGIRLIIIEPGAHDTRGYHVARDEDRFAADSPHEEHRRRFAEAIGRLPVAQPGDPLAVADTIYSATFAEEPKLRYGVGEGAEEIIALRRQLDDAQWEEAMRKTLDIWD
jgi:NAD(P)-dependent dehydrogenase (short-subunit alcohol dehydrogenase family)